ncbi:helix-turn-helix domain-containing protein [Pedobacter rhodius]|uniref:Helix-turn-helix domain-containing protein n=1 Tax=Pedobacter rhodius TaxID=3004098 RepID=A0ABT4KUN0_9SPHI|nr:helix-turn-helix domain-containing protein [Pedobacter sp. SJ11]MCZ4222539.1 helix-turn-helix domain-containing protein [Pedobacter sp. SJ11]
MIIENLTCGALLLLSVLLISNPLKINTIANRWLSLFIFCIFSALIDVVFFKSGTYLIFPHLKGLSELFMFAMAPALYLSVVYFTSPEHHFKSISLFHFLPCLIFLLYQLPYFFNDVSTKRLMQEHPEPLKSIDFYRIVLLTFAIKLQFLIYWLLAYLRVRKHQKNIRLLTSNLQPIHLQWLYYLLFFLMAMYLLWLNTVYFHLEIADKITAPAYLLASFFIAYYSLKQKEVFAYSEPVLKDIIDIFEAEERPVLQIRVNDEEIQVKKKEIEDFMISSEIYLDATLSLPSLSLALGYPVHDLSYVINRGFNQNFYQFVNAYRLNKAKILLVSEAHKHLNMVGIAYACGFNSKTVFNTAFKKLTGQTPSEYKRQIISS